MIVLVTGGNGFIGRHVVSELQYRGYTPLVFDNRASLDADSYLGDIRDDVAVTEAMAHADAWIHLAGVLGTQETIKNPSPAAQTNILGGLNVFRAAAQYDVPGVNIAVGNHWENNTYSITKSTMERFAKMFNKELGTAITVVRALNAYGPGQSAPAPYGYSKVRKIMPSFVCRTLDKKPIEIYGDGDQIMDMIYVEDVANVLVGSLEYTREFGAYPGVFEAGSGNKTTVNDIADMVIRGVGNGSKVHLPMRPGESVGAVVLGDPNTLEDLLEFDVSPKRFTPLDQGVEETVKYFRSIV